MSREGVEQRPQPFGYAVLCSVFMCFHRDDRPEAIVEYVWKNLVPELCEITYFFRLGHDGQ